MKVFKKSLFEFLLKRRRWLSRTAYTANLDSEVSNKQRLT